MQRNKVWRAGGPSSVLDLLDRENKTGGGDPGRIRTCTVPKMWYSCGNAVHRGHQAAMVDRRFQEELTRLVADDLPCRQIAQQLGVSFTTVRYWAIKMELPRTHKSGPRPSTKSLAPCANCGENVKRRGPRYCSNRCRGARDRQNTIEKWLRGEVSGSTCHGSITKAVRAYLLEQSGWACSKCGFDKKHPIDGKPVLEVHHIDGDAANTVASNLEVLCPNCHAMTPHYRYRNRTSSRVKRYARASDCV